MATALCADRSAAATCRVIRYVSSPAGAGHGHEPDAGSTERVARRDRSLEGHTRAAESTATVTFTDNGVLPARQHVQLSVSAPAGWTVTATSATSFDAVESGQTVQATFQVVAPEPNQLFQSDEGTATAAYQWGGKYPESSSVTTTVVTSPELLT